VHDWFAQHARESSLELLRNESASNELNDLRWRLQDLLNQGAPLTGLEDVGIQVHGDGHSVSFDLARFPQWLSFEQQVAGLADPDWFRAQVPAMNQHGLTADNLQAPIAYLTNNDLHAKRFQLRKSLNSTYWRIG
jgi:hypothetical protein